MKPRKLLALLAIVVLVGCILFLRWKSLAENRAAAPEKELEVVLLGRNILEEVTTSFRPGDEISQFSKKSLFGTIVKAEVRDVFKANINQDGEIIYSKLPLRKDLYLTVRTRGFKDKFGSYIVDNNRMLVGQQIYIDNGRAKMYVTIYDVREVK